MLRTIYLIFSIILMSCLSICHSDLSICFHWQDRPAMVFTQKNKFFPLLKPLLSKKIQIWDAKAIHVLKS